MSRVSGAGLGSDSTACTLASADSCIASVTRCRASLLLESISNALPALRDTQSQRAM